MAWSLRRRSPDRPEQHEHQAPPVPTDSCRRFEKLGKWRSVEEHAQALVERLAHAGLMSGSALATDLQQMHILMCKESGWLLRPWAPISKELRLRSGGRKTYAWIDGHRRRVFSLDKLIVPCSGDGQNA